MDRVMTSSIPRTINPPRIAPVLSFHLTDAAKRAIDLCGSLAGLVLLAPLFAVVAIFIRRHSPGPVFYSAIRAGRNGTKFGMLKFRTMEQWHDPRRLAKVTAEDDPRVTPLGRRLRATKINELPQLWNVLKGEMSLVGPRPEDPDIVATWPEDVRGEILSVKPGITSPASVLYRDEESLLSSQNWMQTYMKSVLPSKLRLDQLYVRRRSFWLDLDVLCWTTLILLPGVRSLMPKEEWLFFGPVSRLGRRYLNWFTTDMLVTFLSMGIVGLMWRVLEPLNVGFPQALLIACGFALLFSLVGGLLGMNRIAWSHALPSDVLGLLLSAVLAGAAALGFNQLFRPQPLLPPGMIAGASTLALAGFVSLRYRRRLFGLAFGSGHAAMRERVLIIGSGETGRFVAWVLGNSPSAGTFQVLGFIDDDPSKQGVRFGGTRVLGGRADICRLVEQYDVGVLVFAIHNISPQERQMLLKDCSGSSARLVIVPDIAASLAAIVADKQAERGNGSEPRHAEPAAEIRVSVAPGISPEREEEWLSDLEQMVQAGDLAALGDRIRAIREGIHTIGPSTAE